MDALFAQIDDLKAQWLAAQPLPPAKDEELWRKFRLEWNYNSNHIEGNTLTYGETELLLISGHTKGGHTIREYEEMKAHDVAVKKIRELAKDREILREKDIRDLNHIILKEPYWAEAMTEHGQPTTVEIIPGEYKRLPNNVRSATGESILFASPTDTPAQMGDLVKWMHAELENPALHPVEFAAALHHRFLCIHPFADGNGRVARLLANYVLMRVDFPPLIVKSSDKTNYIAALRYADTGDGKRLADYFAHGVQWSLELVLRAAKGLSLAVPGDVEKEVAIFIKQQTGEAKESLGYSPEAIKLTLDRGLRDLILELKRKLMTLAPLFEKVEMKQIGWHNFSLGKITSEPTEQWKNLPVFKGYRRNCAAPFDLNTHCFIQCEQRRFVFRCVLGGNFARGYGVPIDHDEIERFTDDVLKVALSQIKREAERA